MAGLSRAAWARAPQGCAKLVGTRGTWMCFAVGSAHEKQLKLIVLELDLQPQLSTSVRYTKVDEHHFPNINVSPTSQDLADVLQFVNQICIQTDLYTGFETV